MRLFHVSEQPGIEVFIPRPPTRTDLDRSTALVWAISEQCLPNYLTPRDCPRVAFHLCADTPDCQGYFSPGSRYCVAIEHGWHTTMLETTLYLYEFSPVNFTLQDRSAGYYVSHLPVTPVSVRKIDDIYAELFNRGVEVRLLANLWPLAGQITRSPLCWSLCRMSNALPPPPGM